MTNSKQIGEWGLHAFSFALQAAILDGWTISEWHPPMDMGGLLVTTVEREEPDEGLPPKPSRADILAKARAAKAAKAAADAAAAEGPQPAQDASEDTDQGQGSQEATEGAPAAHGAAEQAPDDTTKAE